MRILVLVVHLSLLAFDVHLEQSFGGVNLLQHHYRQFLQMNRHRLPTIIESLRLITKKLNKLIR